MPGAYLDDIPRLKQAMSIFEMANLDTAPPLDPRTTSKNSSRTSHTDHKFHPLSEVPWKSKSILSHFSKRPSNLFTLFKCGDQIFFRGSVPIPPRSLFDPFMKARLPTWRPVLVPGAGSEKCSHSYEC